MSAVAGAAAVVLLGVTPAFADDPRWSFKTAVFYSVGDYGTDKDKGQSSTTSISSKTEDGVGDVLLKGSYTDLRDEGLVPEVAPYVKIKFPTADEDRGLGTGEFDEAIGVELSKRLGERLTGFLALAYTFIGDPPDQNLRDSFGWSMGADYAVTPPFSLFAFLEGATAIDPSQQDPLELRVGAEDRITKTLSMTGAVSRGLSDGSADWGVSASLEVRF